MTGASASADRAGGPADLSRDASQPEALIPSAAEDMASKTPAQIGAMMNALTRFIGEWSKVVGEAEERVQRERELLMMAMAELTKLAHYVARSAADVLEAQGIEAGTVETERLDAKHESPTPTGDAPDTPDLSTPLPSGSIER